MGHQGLAHKLSIAVFARLFPTFARGCTQDYSCAEFGDPRSLCAVTPAMKGASRMRSPHPKNWCVRALHPSVFG
jgi:hypothetical protein